nr:hypothetical protein [Tanacetum cinerariifolium]
LAGIFAQAGFLVEQVRHGLGIVELLEHQKAAHQPNQRLLLGVGVFAGAIHVLKREHGIIKLHLVKPRPAHQDVGVVGPVGARPVLNGQRRFLDNVVEVGPRGAHRAAIQGREERQHPVIIVQPAFVERGFSFAQLFAGQKIAVVAGGHVVELVAHQRLVGGAAGRAQAQQRHQHARKKLGKRKSANQSQRKKV